MRLDRITHLVAACIGKHQLVLARQDLALGRFFLDQVDREDRVGHSTSLAQYAQRRCARIDKVLGTRARTPKSDNGHAELLQAHAAVDVVVSAAGTLEVHVLARGKPLKTGTQTSHVNINKHPARLVRKLGHGLVGHHQMTLAVHNGSVKEGKV